MRLFVLTGSQQFDFRARISQTLAGRIALVQLLPFSISEIKKHTSTLPALNSLMYQGFYPPIYDRNVLPSDWYAAYVQTYVERDLQQIIQVKDIDRFRNFLGSIRDSQRKYGRFSTS